MFDLYSVTNLVYGDYSAKRTRLGGITKSIKKKHVKIKNSTTNWNHSSMKK